MLRPQPFTTREFLLPLLSYVYEGSRNDVSIFPDYLKMMIKRHTILIKRSDKLKEGQIRGLLRDIDKKTSALEDLKEKLASPKAKKRKKERQVRKTGRSAPFRPIYQKGN